MSQTHFTQKPSHKNLFHSLILLLTISLQIITASTPPAYTPTTTEAFEEIIYDRMNDYVLVVHNGPCGNKCTADLEIFGRRAAELHGLRNDVLVYSFDTTDNEELIQHFQIRAKSHKVVYVSEGQEFEMNVDQAQGSEDEKDIVKAVKSLVGKGIIDISDEKNAKIVADNNTHFFLYFSPEFDENYFEVRSAAKYVQPNTVYYTGDASIAKGFGVSEHGFWFIDLESMTQDKMNGSFEVSELAKFMNTVAHPVPDKYTRNKLSSSLEASVKVILLAGNSTETANEITEEIKKLSSKVKSGYHALILTEKNDPSQQGLISSCGGFNDFGTFLCILGHDEKSILRYAFPYEEPITENSIRRMIEELEKGTLKQYTMIEKIKEPKTANVHNLNSETMKTLMRKYFKIEHPVLIYFYRHDFPNIEKFHRMLEKISLDYKEEDLIFARINFRKNDMPEFSQLMFPLLQLTTGFKRTEGDVYMDDFDQEILVRDFIDSNLAKIKNITYVEPEATRLFKEARAAWKPTNEPLGQPGMPTHSSNAKKTIDETVETDL